MYPRSDYYGDSAPARAIAGLVGLPSFAGEALGSRSPCSKEDPWCGRWTTVPLAADAPFNGPSGGSTGGVRPPNRGLATRPPGSRRGIPLQCVRPESPRNPSVVTIIRACVKLAVPRIRPQPIGARNVARKVSMQGSVARSFSWSFVGVFVSALWLAGCGITPESPKPNEGIIQLSSSAVPNDVACVRLTVANAARTVVSDFDATPGQALTASLSGLPIGMVSISAEAFAAMCPATGAPATWISEPLTATLVAGIPMPVQLTMRPNGRIDLSIDWEDDAETPRCGNGFVDPGEQCDDGNLVNGDGCEANCTLPACGNDVLDPGEQCDDGNLVNGDGCEANCTLPTCGNGILDPGEQCDDGNTTNGDGCDSNCRISTTVYLKASNTGSSDEFGTSVALSADGSTLAVGAPFESSASTGINGGQTDNSAGAAGAVYVFTRSGVTWIQQAYIKASNTGADNFGLSVALSADGSTLAVGAPVEASAATGINGNQADNSALFAGAVYVFTRSGTTWSQQAYIKPSNTGAGDEFGVSVALTADGSILAVGALDEDSAATGINGNQADNSALDSGAVYVFTRTGTMWSQQAYLKASNTGAGDEFGLSVALSADGLSLAVGAPGEDSAATGVGGNQANNSASSAGAAYLFTRSGTTWIQQAYIKASNAEANDQFGWSVALSANGSTLAIGARSESGDTFGVGGDQSNNSAPSSGAVYVFTRSNLIWSQQAYIKASNTEAGDLFGQSVALSADGSTLAVGAILEDSSARGVGGDQVNNFATDAGATYTFTRNGSSWSQQAYIKASNTGSSDRFGYSVTLSGDGMVLVVGALNEGSAATGIGGNQTDNSASFSGAAYVFQ
jgi:cysteine-rich repeat protein